MDQHLHFQIDPYLEVFFFFFWLVNEFEPDTWTVLEQVYFSILFQ